MSPLRLVPPSGAPIEINKDRTLVGRDPSADVVLNDPSVSRRHAVIEWRAQGWVVVDQRSANGTWINGHRMDEALLQGGEELRLGAVAFEVGVVQGGRAPEARRKPEAPPQYTPPPQPVPSSRPAAPAYSTPAYQAPSHQAPSPQAVPAGVALGAGGMTEAEAAEILGLWPGTPADEVRRRYQKMYNDFQIRLTNAPTPSLKRMYQKNIQDLRTACEVLAPGAVA